MLSYTFNAVVLMLGMFFLSITVMVVMIIVGVADDKQYRLQQLLKNPIIGDVLHQVPNEITVLFYRAVEDNTQIDTYMLEYLEFYTQKAK